MRYKITIFVGLVLICATGTLRGQVARYSTTFPKVTMPNQVGQQVFLGSVLLDGLLETAKSFDLQASGAFHGDWSPTNIVDVQESFDLYLCDRGDCKGSIRSQIGHVILVPFAISACIDGVLTLRATVVKTNRGSNSFTSMLDGAWTGRILPNQNTCDINFFQWADGLIDRIVPVATGPTGALPWISAQFVDTSQPLFLVLMTTLVANDNTAEGTGQLGLMRVVVYP